jgi:hypothetical protein
MNTNIIGRRTARALAVVLLAGGAAIGLAACQPRRPRLRSRRSFRVRLIEC